MKAKSISQFCFFCLFSRIHVYVLLLLNSYFFNVLNLEILFQNFQKGTAHLLVLACVIPRQASNGI